MRAGSLLIVEVLFPATLAAQAFPPGYVDPAPLLAAASKEIGEANLKCITISGTAYAGAVGQTFESAVNVDWPVVPLMNLFDTHEPPPTTPTAAMTTLYRQIRMLDLDVAMIAPVHGQPVPMSEFLRAMGPAANECPIPGEGTSLAWGPCR